MFTCGYMLHWLNPLLGTKLGFFFSPFLISTSSRLTLAEAFRSDYVPLVALLRHSPSFWEVYSIAQFFLAFGVHAVGKKLMVENKFSWVRLRSRMYYHPSSCELFPIPQLCWGSLGASISVTVPNAPGIVGCSSHHVFLL